MSKRLFTWIVLLAVAFCLVPNLSHARWYDPETGQWISVDPAFDFPGNFGNPHAYVGQNPVTYVDPSGRNFDLNSQLGAAAVSLQVAAMRLAPHAPAIGDVLLGFVVDDPTLTLTPLGSTVNVTKRAAIETVMHKNIISRGFDCVAMQFRSNGPGIDALYLRRGTSVLDDAKNLFRVEYKVTGSGRAAQDLLGSPSYGIQTSKSWDIKGYERLKSVAGDVADHTWDSANDLSKRINWTSLSADELEYAIKNSDNVQKRLIGAIVIDDATDRGGPMVIQIKEFAQEYVGGITDAPKASFLSETRLEVVPAQP